MAVLSDRHLNRITLHRQHLIERVEATPLDVIRLLVGMQGQDPELPHIGLWNRVRGFTPADLDALLESRQVARATLYRCTQHLLATSDYVWVRPLLQPLLGRMTRSFFTQWANGVDQAELTAAAAELLDGVTLSRPQLGRALQQRWPHVEGVWLARAAQVALPIVHPHPDGTWGKRGPTPFQHAEQWLSGPFETGRGRSELVLRYLAGFGPASVKDMQAWSGLTRMRPVFEELRPQLVTYRNEYGVELFDLPGHPLPDPGRPAPVRFLAGFDNVTFGYADRRRIIADEHRPALVAEAGLTVDGFVRGTWKLRGDTVRVTLFGGLNRREEKAVRAEGEALTDFLGAGRLELPGPG